MSYHVIDVTGWKVLHPEQMGSKAKHWLIDPANRQWLFKQNKSDAGEDWAEVIAARLCGLLGLPHVEYKLAASFEDGKERTPGVICPNIVDRSEQLIQGNVLLRQKRPTYPQDRKRKIKEYTVEAVVEAMGSMEKPPAEWMKDAPSEMDTAIDVFIGYTLLDA